MSMVIDKTRLISEIVACIDDDVPTADILAIPGVTPEDVRDALTAGGGGGYKPYGAASELQGCKADIVILGGPAGTGKSRACLEKVHRCAQDYPGCRWLIVRQTRSSLTESALVTYEDKVLPPGSPISAGVQRRMRQAYRYPNGSEVIIGGLDNTTKIMSTEYDGVYIQEAIEVDEGAVEDLSTRLRNGRMPYQQIIGDTNPGPETHWIKQWSRDGKLLLLDSRHKDNPTIFDQKAKHLTERGAIYIARLDALSGVRRDRLRFGLWVSAEGMIYEGWQRAEHLLPLAKIPGVRIVDGVATVPAEWPRYLVVDFGFTNPFVCQWWAVDPDGRLIRYREIYRTQRLVEDHVTDILRLTLNEPRPIKIICDHDAEDRATFETHCIYCATCDKAIRRDAVPLHGGHTLTTFDLTTTSAHKTVSDGIQAVASRLKKQPDDKPRIYFVSDALVEIDDSLKKAKKPTCTEEEIEGYVWDTSAGAKKGEKPVKENDHGMDASRYMVADRDLAPPPNTVTRQPEEVRRRRYGYA